MAGTGLNLNDRDPVIQHLREKVSQHNKDNLYRGVHLNEPTKSIAMTAAVVKPFWESPRELVWSRMGRNLMGKVANSETMYTNLGFGVVLWSVFLMQGLAGQYALLQCGLSLAEQLNLDQTVDFTHSNSARTW